MKRKRLDRDSWWTFNKVKFPEYYQLRVDIECFHGLVCLLKLIDGERFYWEFPKSGKVPVIGKGMTWLQLIPDGKKRVVTAMYLPERVSLWYVDVIEDIEFDADGVAIYVDKYLDVIFTPQGDVKIDDKDELDAALKSGDITFEQYSAALEECDAIVRELCADIAATETRCDEILKHVTDRIANGEKRFITKYDAARHGT